MGGTDKLCLSVVLLSREESVKHGQTSLSVARNDSGWHGQAMLVRGPVFERREWKTRTNEFVRATVCPCHPLCVTLEMNTDFKLGEGRVILLFERGEK